MADAPSRRRKLYRKKTRDANFKRGVSNESSSDSEPGIVYREPLKRPRLDGSSSSTSGNQERDGDNATDGDGEEEGGRRERSDDNSGLDHNAEENLVEDEDRQPDNSAEMSDGNAGDENVNDDRRVNEDDENSDASEHVPSDSESETEHSDDESVYEDAISDQEDFDDRDNQPIYDGAPITRRESAVSILSFSLTHKLSGACINDLLALIALHCLPINQCLTSLYLFKKYFDMLGREDSVRHYFCSGCEVPLQTKTSVCGNCGGRSEVSYFLEFPLATQLQGMFRRPQFYEALHFRNNRRKKNENNLEDMFDGEVYKEWINSGFLLDINSIYVTFNMFFDGLSVFKNSKFQLWPCYLSINELKDKDRTKKENVVIAGLWFGKKKPNPNLFLRPICVSLERFQFQGLNLELPNGQVVNVKGRVLCAVGDLPAKALFMKLTQYNGLYSCFNCLSSGGRYGVGNGTIQVFPFSRNFEPRRTADMVNFAHEALLARQVDPDATVYGVKGPTLLAGCLPDFINCMGLDVMHAVFLGLMKTLMGLWFSTEHKHCDFNISNCIDIVDSRLKSIKPPISFQRLPHSIKDIALMKASDFKCFFFFYSIPILFGLLPDLYWNHHCKIVSAITSLSRDSISDEEIDTAEELILSYVLDFQNLYGIRYLGLNLHQLLHLCFIVRNLGPTWVYSCFFYESLNGQLLRLVHGTRHAALQISSSAFACLNLAILISRMAEGEAKELCLKFLNSGNKRHKIAEVIDDDTSVLGLYHEARLPRYITELLWNTFAIPNEGRFKQFFRLKRKGWIYSSENYVRSTKRQSCFVEVCENGVPQLGKIKSFVRWSSCGVLCPKICNVCPNRFVCVVALYDRVPWQLHDLGLVVPHLNKVKPSARCVAVSLDRLSQVCLFFSVEDNEFMCTPVNSLEIE